MGEKYIPSSNSDDEIHHHEQDTLQPVGLAISNEVVDQKNSDKKNDNLEGIEVQSLLELAPLISISVPMQEAYIPYHERR